MAEFKTIEIDALTSQVVERDMNEEELANHQILVLESNTIEQKIEDKKLARQSALAKLAALGLTEEEISAL